MSWPLTSKQATSFLINKPTQLFVTQWQSRSQLPTPSVYNGNIFFCHNTCSPILWHKYSSDRGIISYCTKSFTLETCIMKSPTHQSSYTAGTQLSRTRSETCRMEYRGSLYKVVPWLRKWWGQVEAEVVSNSGNKFHQTWERPYSEARYRMSP